MYAVVKVAPSVFFFRKTVVPLVIVRLYRKKFHNIITSTKIIKIGEFSIDKLVMLSSNNAMYLPII